MQFFDVDNIEKSIHGGSLNRTFLFYAVRTIGIVVIDTQRH